MKQVSAGTGHGQIYKNSVAVGADRTTSSGTYSTFSELFTGQLNTTDTIELRGYSSTSLHNVSVDEFKLKYDYSVVSITSPANNSAQTSRTVNITTDVGNIQYQVSQESDFSTLIYNAFPSNYSFSGNLTFPVGLNYIRVRGYNSTEDSITNWSTSLVNVYTVFLGGSGYNWSNESIVYDNITTDVTSRDHIVPGLYLNTFTNDDCTGWTSTGGTWICTNGNMSSTDNTSAAVKRWVNGTDFANVDLLMKYYTVSEYSGNSVGQINRVQNATNMNLFWKASGSYYAVGDYVGGSLYSTNTADPEDIDATWYYMESMINGTYGRGRYWLTSSPLPTEWNHTRTLPNWTTGSIGIWNHRRAVDYDYIWARHVDSSGNVKTDGNVTVVYDGYSINNSASGVIQWLGVFGNSNEAGRIIDVYISSSPNNTVYNSETLLKSNMVNATAVLIPEAYRERYLKVKYYLNGSYLAEPSLWGVYIGIDNASVSGYVHYPNGSVAPDATVLWYNESVTTDASGHYALYNISSGNRAVTAGMSGYRAVGSIIDVNGTPITQNYTLLSFSQPIQNVFFNESYNTSVLFLKSLDANGTPNACTRMADESDGECGGWSDGETGNYNYGLTLVMAYTNGMNVSASFLERVLMSVERRNQTIRPAFSSTDHSNNDFRVLDLVESVRRLKPYINETSYNGTYGRWNATLSYIAEYPGNMTYPYYDYQNWWLNASNNTAINNHAGFMWLAEYGLYENGNYPNLSRVDILTQKFNAQVLSNGFVCCVPSEPTPSMVYNLVFAIYSKELILRGYSNSTFQNNSNLTFGYAVNVTLADGDHIQTGRTVGNMPELAAYTTIYALADTDRNVNYMRLDKSFQKILASKGWYDGNYYYLNREYFRPGLEVGKALYHSWVQNNLGTMYFLMRTGELYDSSVYETNVETSSFNDTIGTGLLFLSKYDKNVWLFPNYYSSQGESYSFGYFNSTGIYPIQVHATTKDALNHTISQLDEVSSPHTINQSINFPWFYGDVNYINLSTTNWTEGRSSSLGDDMLWINWSNVTYGDNKNISYWNTSVKINDTGIIHIQQEFAWDTSSLTLLSFNLPFSYLYDDNQTTAIVSISGTDFNFTRGKESFTIRNLTAINADTLSLENESLGTNDSYTAFGLSKRTLIKGNILDSPVTISYDLNITTTNVYEFLLNQPPGVMDYSPETPLTTAVNSLQQFGISFSQNNINVSWQINGTEVQTNTSISGGTTVYYTNTSGVAGFWNLSAIGCNAQGCAMQTWGWTVDGTPPASITNLTNTTGTTWANWTWTNPVDTDFNHTMIYINNTWIVNTSAIFYLNSSFTPDTEYIISTRTVDTYGNINASWVNQTTTTAWLIPKPIVSLSCTNKGSTWINCTWARG